MGFTWGLGQTTRQARRRERLKLRVPWPSRRSPSVACREEAGASRGVLEATAAPPTPRTCRIFRGQCGATARLNVLRRCRGRYAAAVQARTGTARLFTAAAPRARSGERVASWTVTWMDLSNLLFVVSTAFVLSVCPLFSYCLTTLNRLNKNAPPSANYASPSRPPEGNASSNRCVGGGPSARRCLQVSARSGGL